MLLQGSIHRFNLAGVLQFLAQDAVHRRARGPRLRGVRVHLPRRRAASRASPCRSPTRSWARASSRPAACTEQQLAEALMEDSALSHDQKKLKPLGQRLIEKGFTSESRDPRGHGPPDLDQVFELAHWQNGVFIYDEPEQMPHFQVDHPGQRPGAAARRLPAHRRGREGAQGRRRRGERGLLRLPARRRVHRGDQAQAPQEGRLPVARDGRRARRGLRQAARLRGSCTAPGTRTPKSMLDASLDSE